MKTNSTRSFTALLPTIEDRQATELRELLSATPVWLPIAPALRSAFSVWRTRDLPRYIQLASLPLLLLIIVRVMIGDFFISGELDARDARLWSLGSDSVSVALVLGVLVAQWPIVQRHYTWLATLFGILLLAKFVAMPQLLENPVVAMHESYFCMIAVTVVTLALHLTFQQAITATLAGGAAGLAVALAFAEGPIKWQGFSYSYAAIAGVCLFVNWLFEEKEKAGFLQALLIRHAAHEKELLNNELSRLAHSDALSGLANRRAFDQRLAMEWDRLRREKNPLGVLFIDVDHFKRYNDHYGHGAGDECLAAVGKAIGSALLRPADYAARYGGEEFVILLPNTDEAGARDVAQRVMTAIDQLAIPHAASTTASCVTVSVGVAAIIPVAEDGAPRLLAQADSALYAAKQSGRHQVCSATSSRC